MGLGPWLMGAKHGTSGAARGWRARQIREEAKAVPVQHVVLVVGDLLAFLLFGALGRASHGLEVSLGTAVGAASPFALAWLGMGLLLGTLRPERAARPLEAIKWAWLTWGGAWPVGLLLRSWILQRPIVWTFALVVLGTNLVILGLWRAAYGWLAGRQGWARAATAGRPR